MNTFIILMVIMMVTAHATKVYMSMDRRMVLVIPGRDPILRGHRPIIKVRSYIRDVQDVNSNPLVHEDLKKQQTADQFTKKQEKTKGENQSPEKKSSKDEKDDIDFYYMLFGLYNTSIMLFALSLLYLNEIEEWEMRNFEVLVFIMENDC